MSRIYDNWERLVAAVLRKQQLWQLFHEHSRSPSILSEASDFSSRSFHNVPSDFSSPGSSSTYTTQREDGIAESEKLFPKLVFISDFSPAFDIEGVLFASAELLGRGTFGSVYAAVMDNGLRIVVKRLNSVSISEPEFKRHMDIVGNVRHENVVPLRAYYSSTNEKLMLYDYHSKGSMYALLHGQTGESRARVIWETRLRIAIGAARGIAEIHRQNGGKLVHGNIKSSNIFLNLKHYGCVSDLGLANIIESTFMPIARCYAPEVKNTRNVSQESDVYSFGILLLELLTGKSTVYVPGGLEVIDLVKLVTSVKSKERAAKVYDIDLLKNDTIREQTVKMLEIGISCVAKSQKKRPKMSKVVKMLEDISLMNPANSVPSKLVFVDDANPAFDLEDMLRASTEMLGKGTFGTSYKSILENGNIIRVKRLKYVTVTLNDFQKHMEVIGRMRHGNVADLRAYYFSKEKLLVYDYYNQEAVSALLHGRKGVGKIPLDLATRMKIAIGVARGIAYVHEQDGGKLIHGHIKSSNIVLDSKKYGIVLHTGLTKVIGPVKRSSIPSPGYWAPEVTDTKKVSQASDVYRFGVILLELVSGRPSQHTTNDGEVISLVKWIQSVIQGDEWTAEVLDAELRRYPNDELTTVQLLKIAMDCVTIAPESRPRMSEVVKKLEEISGIETSIESGLDDPMEDTGEGLSIESRLEDLLEDLLPKLRI